MDYEYRNPIRCEICSSLTNGYSCRSHILCAYCLAEYKDIPNHIPMGLWRKYVNIKKGKMPLL